MLTKKMVEECTRHIVTGDSEAEQAVEEFLLNSFRTFEGDLLRKALFAAVEVREFLDLLRLRNSES